MEQFGILSLGSRLKRLSDYLYSEVQSIYTSQSLKISSTYFPILRLLQQAEALSVVEISEQLGLSHPAVSKQVAKMLKEGLLLKVQDPHDQRRSSISLSELSKQEMLRAEPILKVIGEELQRYLDRVSGSFLQQLELLEGDLLNGPYAKRVIYRLNPEQLVIRSCNTVKDFKAFKQLNLEWLEKYFCHEIYTKDTQLLSQPQKYIGDLGGVVKVASLGGEVIGAYYVLPHLTHEIELGKLAVTEAYQGLGIGEVLLSDAMNEAKELGGQRLMLESHTSLKPALNLYRKAGFIEDLDADRFSVPRANIRMIKQLVG
ncbi:bifunctional helix-turn-helix transcriptional regulator/GNAT family N-acetyltransferase [Marinomonas ostreistagni]|uniref:Bifunctional helix-turn-helix transcriptional regulator/GNAT family N-acetyltransferase n=1 Tax=Marinomonas ostreistagni TaxID=359209 RepID=A0ABS0ZDX6_9GAMM|nr:bifunctional helix-turn-helix transcriptional regulator/GNAT family N-acetyltransferase [Marinomonas ostreistagni]MBJ7551882.1 bifunctional helix-turn-helix transcriptional regulator/GNAT family N-acetyltransferase [Marinomonas ostreistagni]